MRENHALERALVINPGQFVLLEEVYRLARALPHQRPHVLGAIVEVQVPGPAHGGSSFVQRTRRFALGRRATRLASSKCGRQRNISLWWCAVLPHRGPT